MEKKFDNCLNNAFVYYQMQKLRKFHRKKPQSDQDRTEFFTQHDFCIKDNVDFINVCNVYDF